MGREEIGKLPLMGGGNTVDNRVYALSNNSNYTNARKDFLNDDGTGSAGDEIFYQLKHSDEVTFEEGMNPYDLAQALWFRKNYPSAGSWDYDQLVNNKDEVKKIADKIDEAIKNKELGITDGVINAGDTIELSDLENLDIVKDLGRSPSDIRTDMESSDEYTIQEGDTLENLAKAIVTMQEGSSKDQNKVDAKIAGLKELLGEDLSDFVGDSYSVEELMEAEASESNSEKEAGETNNTTGGSDSASSSHTAETQSNSETAGEAEDSKAKEKASSDSDTDNSEESAVRRGIGDIKNDLKDVIEEYDSEEDDEILYEVQDGDSFERLAKAILKLNGEKVTDKKVNELVEDLKGDTGLDSLSGEDGEEIDILPYLEDNALDGADESEGDDNGDDGEDPEDGESESGNPFEKAFTKSSAFVKKYDDNEDGALDEDEFPEGKVHQDFNGDYEKDFDDMLVYDQDDSGDLDEYELAYRFLPEDVQAEATEDAKYEDPEGFQKIISHPKAQFVFGEDGLTEQQMYGMMDPYSFMSSMNPLYGNYNSFNIFGGGAGDIFNPFGNPFQASGSSSGRSLISRIRDFMGSVYDTLGMEEEYDEFKEESNKEAA